MLRARDRASVSTFENDCRVALKLNYELCRADKKYARSKCIVECEEYVVSVYVEAFFADAVNIKAKICGCTQVTQ